MKPEIFEVSDGQIVINEHILSIPELRAVYEFYEDPKPALMFLRHLCDPFGPYNQLEEEIKEETLFNDFPGDYTMEDDVMIDARKKLDSMYMTPTYRYFLDNKVLMETVGRFSRTTNVVAGKDGNYNSILMQLKNLGTTIAQFKMLERIAEEELKKGRTRGDAFTAYDDEDPE
jgi:hypothetical protein